MGAVFIIIILFHTDEYDLKEISVLVLNLLQCSLQNTTHAALHTYSLPDMLKGNMLTVCSWHTITFGMLSKHVAVLVGRV